MRVVFASIVCFALGAASLSAQGLAAVAKKEEERRKAVAAGKVYKNGDLKRDSSSPPPPPASNASPSAPTSTSAPTTQVPSTNSPASAVDDAAVKDEKYWRTRITAARSTLDRSRIFADALQSRLNALATDFVNRDDPAQRAQLELERQRTVAELERVKKEVEEHTNAIRAIEEEARKAGVPPGWLR